jgi:hypothetical protein
LRWQLAQALTKAGRKTEAREELRAAMGAQPLPAPQADMDKLRAELGG